MKWWPRNWIGGYIPATAPLASTASRRLIPLAESKTVRSPVFAVTVAIKIFCAGHDVEGSCDATKFRRAGEASGRVASAIAPLRFRISAGGPPSSLVWMMSARIFAKSIFRAGASCRIRRCKLRLKELFQRSAAGKLRLPLARLRKFQ